MQRRVDLFHQRDRFIVGRTDDDAVGLEKVFDGRAFAKELRVRNDGALVAVAGFIEDALD